MPMHGHQPMTQNILMPMPVQEAHTPLFHFPCSPMTSTSRKSLIADIRVESEQLKKRFYRSASILRLPQDLYAMLRHAMMPPRSGGSPLALFRCCLSIDAHSLPPPGSSADLVAHLPEARFTKIMACNRGEIAVRIMRATTELDIASVGIYSHEDRHMQHRYKCDESYVLKGAQSVSPVGAYLDIDEIIRIALDAGVEAIHPGYGFLSENEAFARACEDNDIVFVGPTIDNLSRFAVRRREEERRSPAL